VNPLPRELWGKPWRARFAWGYPPAVTGGLRGCGIARTDDC